MNWTVEKYLPKVTNHYYELAEDKCEHVEVDGEGHYSAEMDSFGIVANYLCCTKCHEENVKCQEERDAIETEVCHDCKQEVARKDIREWKWYDFYAPQGDEPLCICKECWAKEKHQQRMAKDRRDYDEEMGRYDSSNNEEECGTYSEDWLVFEEGSEEPGEFAGTVTRNYLSPNQDCVVRSYDSEAYTFESEEAAKVNAENYGKMLSLKLSVVNYR